MQARNAESRRMAVADAIPKTTAGSRRAALDCVSACSPPNDYSHSRAASVRIVEPRRADARRSCERAFVHRECRFFTANERSQRNTGAVWRKLSRGKR
jgi:hypothetical protein